jgi:hypothetical protein
VGLPTTENSPAFQRWVLERTRLSPAKGERTDLSSLRD